MDRGQFFDSYPIVELDSDDDDESCTSSEDEIDVLLAGRQKQNDQSKNKITDRKSSSSEDEFEKEMAAELDQRMASIESIQKGSQSVVGNIKKKTSQSSHKSTEQKYEDEFLDSIDRSDDEGDVQNSRPGQSQPSNDELLYDPDMDDEDQEWVDKQRQRYQLKGTGRASNKRQYTSDAVLCCPACMVCLCRDCQRHSTYKNQFRAMFVMNCSVDKTEVMKYPVQGSNKKNKNKKKKIKENEGTSNENQTESDNVMKDNSTDNEVYHPVRCDQCTTEVGVFDSDEVFHFFNVIESNG